MDSGSIMVNSFVFGGEVMAIKVLKIADYITIRLLCKSGVMK